MTERLISFETAKLAKSLGFSSPTSQQYNSSGEGPYHPLSWGIVERVSAPTQSLLQKWLREKHSIDVFVLPVISRPEQKYKQYCCEVMVNFTDDLNVLRQFCGTYEDSLELGLRKGLKLIQKNTPIKHWQANPSKK